MVLFFSVIGEEKYEINFKKKKKIFFFSFRELFHYFWSLASRKRSLGSVSGVRRRRREPKKVILM